MRILFIYQYCLLGGVTTQLVNRLEGLKDEWDVHFLFLGDYGGRKAFQNQDAVYIINNYYEFKRMIERNHYDVISIIDTNQIYEWLKSCEYKGVIMNEVHTTTRNLQKIQQLKDEKRIKLMITPSQYMKRTIEDSYGFKGVMPVEVLPNCIDPHKFPIRHRETSQPPHWILWVGKLDDHKRWYDFLEIARKLEYEYNQTELQYIMVGGITAKQEVVDTFMNQLRDKKLMHKVKWYSAINYEEMYELYGRVYESGGVYVSTTTNESFGMTVLEAMCMHLPVVVPRVGALTELCEAYGGDTLYTFQNLDEACRKILKQLNQERAYGVEQYAPKLIGKRFKDIVQQYISN